MLILKKGTTHKGDEMTPWQVLRAGRATQASLSNRVCHGPGVSVRYCMAAAASAASDSSRSLCWSREKLTLQQLNRRLSTYLQQVKCLEETNQRLEHQIQEALERKSPKEHDELVQHLRTASVLQDQIGECLSAHAHVKLQLLTAELGVFNFSVRCEKELERRERLEWELSNLRLLDKQMKVHKLPELQSLLDDQTQQLMELQMQHQQDMQRLRAQGSGSITLERQTDESSDLIKELDDMRQMSFTLLYRNQNKCWSDAQVFSSPEVSSSVRSEVVQPGLKELRRTAAALEEELSQLQTLEDQQRELEEFQRLNKNVLLEATRLEQTESSFLQLVDLQQREDSLCRELDSTLQAALNCTTDHHTLLYITGQLETEIQDYRRLLDELSQDSPAACRRQAPLDRTVSVERGNLRMKEVQRGHMCSGQTTQQGTTVQFPVIAHLPSSKASQSHLCSSKSAVVVISGEITLVDDNALQVEALEAEGKSLDLRLDQSLALFDVSTNKFMKHNDSSFGTAFSNPDNDGNVEGKAACKEKTSVKKVELVVNSDKIVYDFHETKESVMAPLVHSLINVGGQYTLLRTTDSKKSTRLTDSDVVMRSSDPEELLSPKNLLLSPTTTVTGLGPENCPGSVETEMLTEQVFSPVDLEDNRGPDLLLSDTDKHLSSVGTKVSLSVEEDGAAGLYLTDAKTQIRPVSKYIFSTKEECQSLSYSDEQALSERDKNRRATILVRKGDSLCFGSFEHNKERSHTFGGLGVTDKEEQLDFEGLYRRAPTSMVDNLQGRYDSGHQKETPHIVSSMTKSTDESNSSVAMHPGTNYSGTVPNSVSKGSAESIITEGVQRGFRHESGEWMVFGGIPGCKSKDCRTGLNSKETNESLMGTWPVTNSPETKYGRRWSGDWMVYRSSHGKMSVATDPNTDFPPETEICGQKKIREVFSGASLEYKLKEDSGFIFPRTGSEESMAISRLNATNQPQVRSLDRRESNEWMPIATHLATNPSETRMYGNRGNGKWKVCGSSESLPITDSKECPPVSTNLATSPLRSRSFGSTGGGEWTVYGMISQAGSNSFATSPPFTGRCSSGGSGEWRVYSRGTGRLSNAGETASVRISTNMGEMISPANTYTHKGPRLSSAGSGGRLISGRVVRRSRSVGSGGSSANGGKLSSSPRTQKICSSGKCASPGSGKWKPIYRSASGCRSSVESPRSSSAKRMNSIQVALSPSGTVNGGSSSTNGGIGISSAGNVSSLWNSGGKKRISSQDSGGLCCSERSKRTSSTGGRVINSSAQPVWSSSYRGDGNNKKISVCKMAALSLSAAGRERSQERRRSAHQPQQQQAAATSSTG